MDKKGKPLTISGTVQASHTGSWQRFPVALFIMKTPLIGSCGSLCDTHIG